MQIDTAIRSPNHGPRGEQTISMIVLHATAGSAPSALAWLTNRAARVSAHYLIEKSGHTYQLVDDEYAAWHAGRASWQGRTAINECSLGIELVNDNSGRDTYPPEQIQALLELAQAKIAQYQITPNMVTRHLDVAMPRGRKTDPAGFPWADFMARLFPQTSPPTERPPRPGPAPAPTLAQKLLAEAYRQVGAVDHQDRAIARVARAEALGLPLGPSFEVSVAGRSYTAQSFGRETLLSPTGDWQRVDRLATLQGPTQQPLHEALLQAVYRQAGETYHPDWAFHEYALSTPIGPPIGPSLRLAVAEQQFSAACYALDVIVCPVGRWKAIERLSAIRSDRHRQALAQVLQAHWAEHISGQARPEWPLYQYALRENLGAPLGPSFRITDGQHDYVAEAFALDILYCEIGNWNSISRLSSIAN
ncbi:MAG TPA: N-acetylmuramoyl-L-alanine amidase [Roseiflexaceae bacterium]|nr:N-acetylmuramoyl-L-alanine amidase [Roseiflexaceae bacterium]